MQQSYSTWNLPDSYLYGGDAAIVSMHKENSLILLML